MADTPPPATPPVPPAPAPQDRWVKLAVWAATSILGALVAVALSHLTGQPVDPLPIPIPQAAGPDEAPVYSGGWVPDPDAVTVIKATLPDPDFADTPAGQVGDVLPPTAYLWADYAALNSGRTPPVKNQNPVGSCVSFGTATAIERSLASQVVRDGRFEFKHVVEEAIYAGSRHEIGRDQIRPTVKDPNGDGSVGAWAARWVTTYGALPRGVYGRYDLSAYSPARCRQWGAVGAGVPDDLEPEVRKFPVGSAAQVTNWRDAKKALAQKYGLAVCSNVGFNKPGTPPRYVNPATRDARGVCEPNGNWGHCMALDGYHTDEQGREYGHIENSWGESAHGGPVGWGAPNTSGFWCRAEVIDQMLRQGDSWAFSAVTGFPRQRLDWFVKAAPARRPVLADLASAW